MGLHDALRPPTGWVWRWYQAYNLRGGRRHLLRVPLVRQDRVRVPSWYYGEEERQRYIENQLRAGPIYFHPSRIRADNEAIIRLCNRAQEVYSWNIASEWEYWRTYDSVPRGWCRRCWDLAQTLPPASLAGPPEGIQRSARREIRGDTDLTAWIRYEQGYDD
jgi:hypothetical protein